MGTLADWHSINGTLTAWFATSSLTAGADLASRVLEICPQASADLRTSGVRIPLPDKSYADSVSSAANSLGLTSDVSALQNLSVAIDSTQPAETEEFWAKVLGYERTGDGRLRDPLGRWPGIRINESVEKQEARGRIHLDAVRPGDVVEQLGLGEGVGPYGLCHRDPDGTEVDLVPGDPLGEGRETSDWRVVFTAMATYRTNSVEQQQDLVREAAAIADETGFPLLIDVRADAVVLDSGKDRWWDRDAHGIDVDFAELAARLQAAAREVGANAEPDSARFVQVFFDATDESASRGFWAAALGYSLDDREGVTDIYDPRWLGPVLVFQPLGEDEARRRQRDRVSLELAVPAEVVATRIAQALAAGGRLIKETDEEGDGEGEGDGGTGRARIADPDGNELVITGG